MYTQRIECNFKCFCYILWIYTVGTWLQVPVQTSSHNNNNNLSIYCVSIALIANLNDLYFCNIQAIISD